MAQKAFLKNFLVSIFSKREKLTQSLLAKNYFLQNEKP